MSFVPNRIIMCFALPFCLPGCSGERKQRYGEVFAINVLLPHLSSQTVTMWFYTTAYRWFLIRSKLLGTCACVCCCSWVCIWGLHIYLYYCCLHVLLFTCVLCNCAHKLAECVFGWFKWKRTRQHDLHFDSFSTSPFTYPHGEDAGIELACQCECLAALHAVPVL